MQETGTLPDFIVIDGAEGGTGASPAEFIDYVGLPMHEALMLVHNTLVGVGLRNRIRVGAAGKCTSAFDIARTRAMGADWCNAAPRFMSSLGGIYSLRCPTAPCHNALGPQAPHRARTPDTCEQLHPGC